MAHSIDVADLIDRRPVGRYQAGVFATCLAIALLDGLDLQAMGLAAPLLAREWNLPPAAFGTVFSAAPAGMVVGAVTVGPVADRIGRKRLIVLATLGFGVGTLLTALAPSLEVMAVVRFLTGLGLGGVLPTLISLVTEFAPGRLRGTLVTIAFSGLPFGSMLAGLLARWLMPRFGWESLFYVGGLLPIGIAVLALLWLPESLRFLALRPERRAEALGVLRRIAPDLDVAPDAALAAPDASARRVSIARLFGPARSLTTIGLALIVAFDLFMLYFTLNWLPTLLTGAGLSTDHALLSTVVVNTGGGIGSVTWGVLIDRFGGFRVMAFAGAAASSALALLGVGHGHPAILIAALFVAGACIMGAMPGLYAVVASVYPTAIRSTGLGTVLGLGRIGSVLGPAAGGFLVGLEWTIPAIFLLVAVPGLLWTACMIVVMRLPRDFA
jgi:AAHS family 4-hydroxybenzoate transporter-like MFS transporter